MNNHPTMPTPVNASAARPASAGLTPRLLWCVLVWFALNGTDWKSWLIGGPVVVLAALLSRSLPATRVPLRLRWAGVPSFVWFFVIESVRGAWDVSRRVIDPRLPIRPGFVEYTPSIPAGPARRLFANLVSLLPGTLSSRLDEKRLIVHALDRDADVEAGLRSLERRVLRLIRDAREGRA